MLPAETQSSKTVYGTFADIVSQPATCVSADLADVPVAHDYNIWYVEQSRVFGASAASSTSSTASALPIEMHPFSCIESDEISTKSSATSTMSVSSNSRICASSRFIGMLGPFYVLQRKNKKTDTSNNKTETPNVETQNSDDDTASPPRKRPKIKAVLPIESFDQKMQSTYAQSAAYFDKHPDEWAIAAELSKPNGVEVRREGYAIKTIRVTLRRLEDFLKYCKTYDVQIEKRTGPDGRGIIRHSVDQLYSRIMTIQNKQGFDPCRRGNAVMYRGVVTTPCQLRFLQFIMEDSILLRYIQLSDNVDTFSIEQRNLHNIHSMRTKQKNASGRRTRHVCKRRHDQAPVVILPPGQYFSLGGVTDDVTME